jgi:CoA:oxalate CoA-transferase
LSAAECEAVMAAGGVPSARYRTVKEAMASPYAAERGLFSKVTAGKAEFLAPNPPFRMSGVGTGARVPALGEDGPPVLENVLKRTPQEIARLVEEGVLCTPS